PEPPRTLQEVRKHERIGSDHDDHLAGHHLGRARLVDPAPASPPGFDIGRHRLTRPRLPRRTTTAEARARCRIGGTRRGARAWEAPGPGPGRGRAPGPGLGRGKAWEEGLARGRRPTGKWEAPPIGWSCPTHHVP